MARGYCIFCPKAKTFSSSPIRALLLQFLWIRCLGPVLTLCVRLDLVVRATSSRTSILNFVFHHFVQPLCVGADFILNSHLESVVRYQYAKQCLGGYCGTYDLRFVICYWEYDLIPNKLRVFPPLTMQKDVRDLESCGELLLSQEAGQNPVSQTASYYH